MSTPREGLPPCLSLAIFDGRGASLVDDTAGCHSPRGGGGRFKINAGTIGTTRVTSRIHPELPKSWPVLVWALSMATDDPDEAKAAFERGAEYVRTGVMP